MIKKNNLNFQFVWGIVLFLAGVGVFFRIPQVMPQIKTIQQFNEVSGFIYFCFYLLGVLLIIGGITKLFTTYKKYKELK